MTLIVVGRNQPYYYEAASTAPVGAHSMRRSTIDKAWCCEGWAGLRDKNLTLGQRAQSLTGGYVRDRGPIARMKRNQWDTATLTPLSCKRYAVRHFGKDDSTVLLMFHSFSGSDTVSALEKGRNQDGWPCYLEFTSAFATVASKACGELLKYSCKTAAGFKTHRSISSKFWPKTQINPNKTTVGHFLLILRFWPSNDLGSLAF